MEIAERFVQAVHMKTGQYIAFARQQNRWQHSFAMLPAVGKVIGSVNIDAYAAPNSFVAPQRRIESLGALNALYADIDDHKKPFRFSSVLYFLQEDYFGSRVPWPNMIAETGRGMHLYWLIEPLPPDKLPLWQLTQNLLLDTLSDISECLESTYVEVDKKVRDATRLLRLPGTINSTTNTTVTLYEYSYKRYYIEDILSEYFPYVNYTKKARNNQASEKAKDKRAQPSNGIGKIFNTYTLHYARMVDIAKLQELRNGFCRSNKELVPTGQRELMCFLYRYYSCLYLQDELEALRQTQGFNQGFAEPLSEAEVTSATRSAERAFREWQETGVGKYNYRNTTLIDLLKITPEEQMQLKTIISTEEKYRRNNGRRNAKRRGEGGMTKRERKKAETLARIMELREQGLKLKEIALSLDMTVDGVKYYLYR